MDKSIDEIRSLKSEFEDDSDYQTSTEEQDASIESSNSTHHKNDTLDIGEKKRFYLFWIIVLLALPPPLGFIVLKMNHVKLRWYHYLLIINIFGFILGIGLLLFVFLPLQARLRTLTTLTQSITIKQTLSEYYDMDSPDASFNFEGGSQSTSPSYDGGLAIDYDKLETLYPGDKEAKVRAQRYQLYSEIEELFGTPKIWLYNVEGQESSSDDILAIDDIYTCYTASVLGGMESERESNFSHALGPFQISSSGKHISLMFESKYSTRENNATTSVYAFSRLSNGSRSSFADGIAYFDRFKGKSATPEYEFAQVYDPNTTDLTSVIANMSSNIKKNAKSRDFDARVLTVEGTKNYVAIRGVPTSNTDSFQDSSLRNEFINTKVFRVYDEAKSPMLMRFNAYYYPDASASTAYDIKWVANTLKSSVQGDNGNQKLLVSQSALNSKMKNANSTYKEFFLNMTDGQQQEVGALFCLVWFNAVCDNNHLDDLFKTSLKTIAKYSTLTKWDAVYTYQGKNYVLFTDKGDDVYASNYGRLQHEWVVIPGSYGFTTVDHNGYDYAFQAMGQGFVEMMKDKKIFDSVKADYSNGNTSTVGYTKIEALEWSKATTMFPRVDAGGPATLECIDVRTGKEFTLKRVVGTNHADCEAETAEDSAIIKEIFGGKWTWEKRPILIKGTNNTLYAASMAGMPHAGEDSKPFSSSNLDYIKGNDMNGVIDVHFRGSKSHVDADYGITEAKEVPEHQKNIDEALQATKYINNNAYGTGSSVMMGPIYDFTDYYPPVLNKKASTKQPYLGDGKHGGTDIVINGNDTLDNVAFIYGTNQYVEATKPKIKIHSVTDGVVEKLRCHAYGKTSSKVDSSTEWSDHAKGTINRSVHGTAYPEYSIYGVAEGDSIAIRGTDGKLYWYMHMFCGSQQVDVGDTVKAGQVIGYMGNTGQTLGKTGIHLHFQIGNAGSTENGDAIAELGYGYDDN